jgi:hypothetical protein
MKRWIGSGLAAVIAASLAACAVPASLYYVGVHAHLNFDPGSGWVIEHAEPYKDSSRLYAIRYLPDPRQPGLQRGRLSVTSSRFREPELGKLVAQIEQAQVRMCPGNMPELQVIARDATSLLIEMRLTPCAVPYRNDRLLPPEHWLLRVLDGERDRFEIRYSLSEAAMTEAVRTAWISRLKAATLTAE